MLAHLKRNAIADAAHVVALGGTSYAAVQLPAGSVGSKELHSGALATVGNGNQDLGAIAPGV